MLVGLWQVSTTQTCVLVRNRRLAIWNPTIAGWLDSWECDLCWSIQSPGTTRTSCQTDVRQMSLRRCNLRRALPPSPSESCSTAHRPVFSTSLHLADYLENVGYFFNNTPVAVYDFWFWLPFWCKHKHAVSHLT